MATAFAVINILGPILIAMLKLYQDGMPERKEEERVQEIQKGRAAIAGGDVGAVSVRMDRVLTAQGPATAGGSAKLGPDADTARRLAEITGG